MTIIVKLGLRSGSGRAVKVVVGAVAASALLTAASSVARGDAGGTIPSVFFVAKSENRNQVHYGIRVDAACNPVGAEPVFAYWRMLEKGPSATEPLLSREVPAYGLSEQHVIERGAEGGRTAVRLRALGGRAIEVTTSSRDGRCEATATTVIGGVPASLSSVYAQLRWPFGVDHLMLWGRASADGRLVSERLSP